MNNADGIGVSFVHDEKTLLKELLKLRKGWDSFSVSIRCSHSNFHGFGRFQWFVCPLHSVLRLTSKRWCSGLMWRPPFRPIHPHRQCRHAYRVATKTPKKEPFCPCMVMNTPQYEVQHIEQICKSLLGTQAADEW